MQITDTIADILTRIRNASTAKHATVDVPASNVKKAGTSTVACFAVLALQSTLQLTFLLQT